MTITSEVAATIEQVRREVAALHAELPRNELVVWTAGNVSARVPGRDLLVIKPSGISYDDLTPANMVITDLEANLVEGDHAPSSDTAIRQSPSLGTAEMVTVPPPGLGSMPC